MRSTGEESEEIPRRVVQSVGRGDALGPGNSEGGEECREDVLDVWGTADGVTFEWARDHTKPHSSSSCPREHPLITHHSAQATTPQSYIGVGHP